MNNLFAVVLMQIWLAAMVYGWFKNRDGKADEKYFDRYSRKIWWRWIGPKEQNREAFLRRGRIVHRLALPLAVSVYLLSMWGVLFGR